MSKDKSIIDAVKKAQTDTITLFRGKGCDKCGQTGYHGRTGIFEVLEMSSGIQKLTLESRSSGEIHELAVKEGMLTLEQDGYLKSLEGITTIEEVLRVAKA